MIQNKRNLSWNTKIRHYKPNEIKQTGLTMKIQELLLQNKTRENNFITDVHIRVTEMLCVWNLKFLTHFRSYWCKYENNK